MKAAAIVLVACVACAPRVETPAERQRFADLADGDRLAAQLAALPGAIAAEVSIRRAVHDPLAPVRPTPGAAAVIVTVDDRADRAAIDRAAVVLARATAPDIADVTVVTLIGATRPTLATVGPFTVEESSRAPLRAALAIALASIALLAAWIALRERSTR